MLRSLARGISRGLALVAFRGIPAAWRWLDATVFPLLRRLWLKLPHRFAVASAAVAGIGLVLVLRPDLEARSAAGNQPAVEVPKREARWVDQLLSDDWRAQKAATRDVLESVGVRFLPDDRLVPERSGLHVSSPEEVMLAMDGARKARTSRLTLAEVAFMLQDFGFPFTEDELPPAALERAVRSWTRASLADSDVPGADAMRVLQAMAARQVPAIDLASDDWAAEEYGLTHLELFAFFAAFADEGLGSSGLAEGVRQPPAGSGSLVAPFARMLDVSMPVAYAADTRSTACSPLAELGKRRDFEQNNKTMEAILGFFGKLGEAGGGKAKVAAKALEAIGHAAKLQKLALLYSSIDMHLTADTDYVHKPHPGEPDKEVVFNVTVGLDEEKYREFVRSMESSELGKAVKECAASLGLPTPTDMGDIAKEMEGWDVRWGLDGGNGILTMFSTGHASWNQEKNGFTGPNHSREPLERLDDTHVGADFIVDIARETLEEGEIVSANITGRATLHSDVVLPGTEVASSLAAGWQTLLGGDSYGALAMIGTLIGATGTAGAEVASGWARRILDPVAYYNVAVAYHREVVPEHAYEGTVTADFMSIEESVFKGRRQRSGAYSDYQRSWKRQGRMIARVWTERMTPYAMNEGVDAWRLAGEGTSTGSVQYRARSDALNSCAGAMLRLRRETRKEDGSGSGSATAPYSMQISQRRNREGVVELILDFRRAGLSVPYRKSWNDIGQAGCEFSSRHGWKRSGTEAGVQGISSTGDTYRHVVRLSEPYPEVISGHAVVASDPHYSSDGILTRSSSSTTTWKWHLRRVDP